jgi:hypothetical protein
MSVRPFGPPATPSFSAGIVVDARPEHTGAGRRSRGCSREVASHRLGEGLAGDLHLDDAMKWSRVTNVVSTEERDSDKERDSR